MPELMQTDVSDGVVVPGEEPGQRGEALVQIMIQLRHVLVELRPHLAAVQAVRGCLVNTEASAGL